MERCSQRFVVLGVGILLPTVQVEWEEQGDASNANKVVIAWLCCPKEF